MTTFRDFYENLIQFLAITIVTALFYFLFFGNIFVPYILWTKFWWLLVCYIVWWYFDRSTYENGGRIVPMIQNSKIFECTAKYFPCKLVIEDGFVLDQKKNYLFSCHPHGVFPFGLMQSVLLGQKNLKKLIPPMKIHLATLPIFNFLPLIRDFVMGLGGISCSEKSLTYILNKPKGGHIVCLMTGGAQEVANTYAGVYKFIINKRKGFIKIAMQTGAFIVPVITFGENEIYALSDYSQILWLQNICKKWFGFVPVFFYGRGFSKHSIGWIPFRKKLTTVVGKPINVEKVLNPTEEQIDAVHAKFVNELSELFHKYKFYLDCPKDKILLLE